MIGQQVPYTISQNVSFATNPTELLDAAADRRSVPADRARSSRARPRSCKAANPRVLGHSFENETPYAEQWHLGVERRAASADWRWSSTYAGSAGKHLVFCYNPNEMQPGIGSQASRRLIPAAEQRLTNMLQCDPRNRSTYHSGQLKVQRRFSGGLQFLVSYTYGEVARLRRLGGERRRRGRQSADGHQPRRRPRAVRLRRAAPRGVQRRLGAAVGAGQADGCAKAACSAQIVGGWQFVRHRHVTTAAGRSPSFMQTGVNNGAPSWPNRIGSGELDDPDRRSVVQPAAIRGAAGQHLRRQRPRHPLLAGPR